MTQGLQLLFHCEYLALVEYVECVIPLVFALNKLILEELPNVVYYPGGAGKWAMSALASVFVYATLEICTLFILNHFLQKKFAFSPLYQLAFALESSMHFVQGRCFSKLWGYCSTSSCISVSFYSVVLLLFAVCIQMHQMRN